jgi:hypothetical protein
LPDNPTRIERLTLKAGKTPYVRFDLTTIPSRIPSMRRLWTVLADSNEVCIVDG